MIFFNGNSGMLGNSLSPLGLYAGYLLLHSGNLWLAVGFLGLSIVFLFLGLTTLCRFVINYHRQTLTG